MKVSLETPELRAIQRQPKTSSQQTSFFSQPFGRVGYRSQRIGRLIFLSSGLLLLIATRLFEIQVIDREQHLSEIYRHKDKTMIEGATGNILDRERGLLAVTDSLPTIGANPGLVDRPRKTASLLAPILGMSIDSLYDRLTNQQQTYINLKREVTGEVADQVRWLDEVGIEIREEKARFYPNGDEFARNLLGQVNIDEEPLNGIEVQYAHLLSGKAGVRQDYVAARRSIRLPGGDLEYQAAEPGSDLVTTIHRGTQYFAERTLKNAVDASGANWGTAVVLDAETAQVLALVDIDRSNEGGSVGVAAKSSAYIKTFEPGSISKTFTIASALEEGRVTPEEIFEIPNTYQFADKKYSDPYGGQQLSVREILAKSSNVGTIQIAERVGSDQLHSYLRRFGFGQYSSGNSEAPSLPDESRGKLKVPQRWEGTDLAAISFGQGISVTAIQIAAAYNVIANDGLYIPPSLVHGTVTPAGSFRPAVVPDGQKVLTAATVKQMREMLEGVVVSGTGTKAAVEGYSAAGKTGTAQKPMKDRPGYGDEYTSIFAGFVPAVDPQITIVVVLDEPDDHSAGRAVAPVFAAIATETLATIGVPETE